MIVPKGVTRFCRAILINLQFIQFFRQLGGYRILIQVTDPKFDNITLGIDKRVGAPLPDVELLQNRSRFRIIDIKPEKINLVAKLIF
jgi:hypothetical protein